VPNLDPQPLIDRVDELLGAKRAELEATLQSIPLGSEVVLDTRYGEIRGRLHGCNGVKVDLINGLSYPLGAIRAVRTGDDRTEAFGGASVRFRPQSCGKGGA